MMPLSRSIWYLHATFLLFVFILYIWLGISFGKTKLDSPITQHLAPVHDILFPETLVALKRDAGLKHTVSSLTKVIVQATQSPGETYSSHGLRSYPKSLAKVMGVRTTRTPSTKRGSAEQPISITAGGAREETIKKDKAAVDMLLDMSTMLGLGDDSNGTANLGALLQKGLSDIGGSIMGDLAIPALFLGVGLGTETGLNLANGQEAQAMAMRVAAAFNATLTRINKIAQSLGSGLSAQLAPVLGSLSIREQTGLAAYSFAQGIGQGTASGLNLTEGTFQPTNTTGIIAIARNIGLGLSTPIASYLDIHSLGVARNATNEFTQQLPQIIAAAGQGLGEGASAGLGLSEQTSNLRRRQVSNNASSQDDTTDIARDFARAFSQSFFQSSDFSKALDMISSSTSDGTNTDPTSLALSVVSGAGQGIGEGAAIALGLQADTGFINMSGNTNAMQDITSITAEFTRSLATSLLSNGTINAVLANSANSTGALMKTIQGVKIAEGLARGLVEGSVNTISMAGGIEKLLSGNVSVELSSSPWTKDGMSFDDSVNGLAIAFGQGLAGEGTLIIAKLIANDSKSEAEKKRDAQIIGRNANGVVSLHRLKRRQSAPNAPSVAGGTMISSLAQAGTDALTCQGFGGLAAMILGLMNSGAIKIETNSSTSLSSAALATLIPQSPITIMNEGNTFEINIRDSEFTINGMQLGPFAIFTSLHVALTTVAFFYALPAYLALGAIWRLSVLIGYPFSEKKNKKWRMRILLGLFFPSSIGGTVLGIVSMGSAPHFRSGHGILGLITLSLVIPTIVVTFLRLHTKAPLPDPSAYSGLKGILPTLKSSSRIYMITALHHQFLLQFSMIAWIQGFSELRSISLCIVDAVLTAPMVVGAVSFLLFGQVGATAIVGMRIYFEGRIAKQEKLGIVKEIDALPISRKLDRTDTIATFGFNGSPPTLARPELPTRQTAELFGMEDSKIGMPFNFRNDDESDVGLARSNGVGDRFVDHPQNINRSARNSINDLFADQPENINSRGSYGEPGPTYKGSRYTASEFNRPSSDIETRARSYNAANSIYDAYSTEPTQTKQSLYASSYYPTYKSGRSQTSYYQSEVDAPPLPTNRYTVEKNPYYNSQTNQLQTPPMPPLGRYQSFSRPWTRDEGGGGGGSAKPSGEEIRVQYVSLMPVVTPGMAPSGFKNGKSAYEEGRPF